MQIACIDFNLQKFRMAMGISITATNAEDLAGIRQKELDITKQRIQKLLDAGANVVFTTKGIDDFAQKYFVDKGVMGVRRVPFTDMKRIAKVTGASIMTTLCDMEGEEVVDPTSLGNASSVWEDRVGD